MRFGTGGPGPRSPDRSDRRPLGTAATGRVTSPRTRAPPRTWPRGRRAKRRLEIRERICVGPVDPHTEMNVRDRQVGMTPTRGGDGLSANHAIALADEDRGEPRARARYAAAVIDREEQPTADLARERDDAGIGSQHHGADRSGDVDASVTAAVRRVRRVVAAHDRAGHWPRPRNGGGRGVAERQDERHRGDGTERCASHGCDARGTAGAAM